MRMIDEEERLNIKVDLIKISNPQLNRLISRGIFVPISSAMTEPGPNSEQH